MIKTTTTIKSAFPSGGVATHVKTIPACVAIGMQEYASDAEGVGAWLDLSLPVCRSVSGLPSRGVALILADQAGAVGTFATQDIFGPMMTLDLRVDWHGTMPAAQRLDVRIDDSVRQGRLSTVRGRIIADGQALVGSLHAAFLTGAFPGGRPGTWQGDLLGAQPSNVPHFEAALRMEARGEDWHIAPDGEMIGARTVPAYHGGFVAAALEQAAWLRSGERHPVNFDIRYLLPTRADLPLTIRTRILRSGKQASIIEAEALQGDAQTLVASARAIFLAEPDAGQEIFSFPG